MEEKHAPGKTTSRSFEEPWDGPSKIVVGVDIGTALTGVAFAFLQQGAKKSIHTVTQWPGQEQQAPDGKIPSVVWYDSTNKAVSFGFEAWTPQAEKNAEEGGWELAESFKPHLHSPHPTAQLGLELEPLPFTMTLSQIYSDFLGYLLKHTQTYFEEHIIDGKRAWQQYRPTMEVVLTHPNGWGPREQSFLRSAAVNAGFTNAEDAISRVHFVHEAEASLHFYAQNSVIGGQLKPGTTFAVCDAGRSIASTTVYRVKGADPIRIEEALTSDCVQAGSLYVDNSVERYLRKSLSEAGLSQEDMDEYTTRGIEAFGSELRRAFKDATEDQTIEIAGTRVTHSAIKLRRGRMTLPGPVLKACFDLSVGRILESVSSQVQGSSVSHILLVGEFGESHYLLEQLRLRVGPIGCDVITTSEGTSRAAADGSIIWYSSNTSVKKTSPCSYGVEILIPRDPGSKDHKKRKIIQRYTGTFVTGGWSQIVPAGVSADGGSVCRRQYYREYTTPDPELGVFTEDIWRYNREDVPQWMRTKWGAAMPGFQLACSVKANLGHLRGALQPHRPSKRIRYWSLSYNICIHFGRTEVTAFLEWEENGKTRTGPAHIVPASESA